MEWSAYLAAEPSSNPSLQPASSQAPLPASLGRGLEASQLAKCSLHNVLPLALGQELLRDLLFLEAALLGTLVRCKCGEQYIWQQIRRATRQPDGFWVLTVGQAGWVSQLPAAFESREGVSTGQAEAVLAELSIRRPSMLSSRLEVARMQWRLYGSSDLLKQILSKECCSANGSVPVGHSALQALLRMLLCEEGVVNQLPHMWLAAAAAFAQASARSSSWAWLA